MFHWIVHAINIAIVAYLVRRCIDVTRTTGVDDQHFFVKCETKFEGLDESVSSDDKDELVHSSVLCIGASDRVCTFYSLCYNHQKRNFVFFLGAESSRENVPLDISDSPSIDLVTVDGHNSYAFHYITLPSSASVNFSITWINATSLICSRFKPDNLMHVLHDDVLPIIYTLFAMERSDYRQSYTTKRFSTRVIFTDDWNSGVFRTLYDALPAQSVTNLNALTSDGDMICFKRAYVGLFKTTLWYQYGFVRPQGPVANLKASGHFLRSAVKYLRRALSVELTNTVPYVVLVSRRETRRITNEAELIERIVDALHIKVVAIDESRLPIRDLIVAVSNSRGLVGVHGALLALAVFLRPGSFIVELFPYAINPDNYTPYKTLANLPGVLMHYRSWRNLNRAKSFGHPEYPKELGGLRHLSLAERERITEEDDVPPHLCCNDPSWLYHIYQDTVVDEDVVVDILRPLLLEDWPSDEPSLDYSLLKPSIPVDVFCLLIVASVSYLNISWSTPWNLEFLDYVHLSFDILVLDVTANKSVLYIVDGNTLSVDVEKIDDFRVWIRASIDDKKGPYSADVLCAKY